MSSSHSARIRARAAEREAPASTTTALRWVTLLLVIGGLMAIGPLWAPLVLACWVAALARPLLRKLSRGGRHRGRGAAIVTTGIVLVALVPLSLAVVSLAARTAELAQTVTHSKDAQHAIRSVISGESGRSLLREGKLDPQSASAFLREHGEAAMAALGYVADAATRLAIGAVVFVLGVYVFLQHGHATYRWIAERVPLRTEDFERLSGAFIETGRGLIVGTGGTALLQAAVAGIGYAVVGVSSVFVLAFMTFVAAFIPSVGTAIVWGPVAAGLWMEDRPVAALVLLGFGIIVSVADNFVRPVLARFGKLELPSFVVFVAMLGGLLAFGGWGILLGPLAVRLAVEALNLRREREAERGAAQPPD
ncbi:MAG: AI-2E family transporter [Polyangiales bacterium]